MSRIQWIALLMWCCAEPPPSVNPDVATPDAPSTAADDATDANTELSPGQVPKPPPGAVVPDPGPGSIDTPLEALYTQDALADGTQISGTLTCSDCKGSVVVRIEDAEQTPPQPLTQKSFDSLGPYTMRVPPGKRTVVMLIDDANGDGKPTPGEGIGIWTGGLLDTSAPGQTVDLEVGVMPDKPPIQFDGDPPAAAE